MSEWDGERCVVLVSNQETLRDISTSLNMLKIASEGATSVNEARSLLVSGKPPLLVMIEGDLEDSTGRVMSFAKSLKDHPDLSDVPICLLVEGLEPEDSPEPPEMIDNILRIPIEFPTFTKDVRGFLQGEQNSATNGSATVVAPEPEESVSIDPIESEEPSAVSQEEGSVSQEEASTSIVEPSARRLLDRRLVVAYGVQLAVLEELEQSDSFQSLTVEEIPNAIAEATKKVCQEFDFKELLSGEVEATVSK